MKNMLIGLGIVVACGLLAAWIFHRPRGQWIELSINPPRIVKAGDRIILLSIPDGESSEFDMTELPVGSLKRLRIHILRKPAKTGAYLISAEHPQGDLIGVLPNVEISHDRNGDKK